MRPRTITTTKLLAVAAASAMGCSTPVQPTPEPVQTRGAQARPPSTEAPTPPAEPPAPTTTAAPAAVREVDPALGELSDELSSVPLDQALKQARFRPLCDAQGYPLVGNVVRKAPINTLPSAYCEAVRKRGTL